MGWLRRGELPGADFDHSSGTDTARAHLDSLRAAVEERCHGMDVRQKTPIGGPMRVTDGLAGHRVLTADITSKRHRASILPYSVSGSKTTHPLQYFKV